MLYTPLFLPQSHPLHLSYTPYLVLRSRRLTRLQLIQIPPANRQAALVLIHALAKIAHVRVTDLGRLVGLVERVLAVLGLRDRLGGFGGRGGGGGAAAEEAADGVADGGAYCDAAVYYGLVGCCV